MAERPHDRISTLIAEVEAIAKKLRVDVRKAARSTGLERQIRSAARELQKRAAKAAKQVEQYTHRLRVELEGAKKPRRRPARKKPARVSVAS